MKRAKRSKKQASPIKMPKGSNRRTFVKRKKKFQFPQIFKKDKYSRRRKIQLNSKAFVIPLLILLFFGLIFISVKYITFIRSSAFDKETYTVGEVTGLEGVPEYEGSEFIFKNSLEDPIVKEFLSGGNSAYRVLKSSTLEEIESYYLEKLPPLGWELVAQVPLGTEDKKYGQYWIKDGKGLRIYSKFKDIWYETITEQEAKDALSNRVKEEIEREMLMASGEQQDLLPDYPWRIQIPKEYIIKYSATSIKDFRAVSFQKLGGSDTVEIYPVGKLGSKELDYLLEDYCKVKSTEDLTYSVVNTVPVGFREYLALRGSITAGGSNMQVIVLPNSFNGTVYVLSSTKENDPLLEYIFENIKPLGAKD
ncbi:MAG: hypothetical protein RBR78_11765 [Flavobacteriaceae bacterium]|jgi:hypothetical protein|nr:hypothetical protein [Flavobacteriaceae bacterium]